MRSETLKLVRSLIQTMKKGEIEDMEVSDGDVSISLSTRSQPNGLHPVDHLQGQIESSAQSAITEYHSLVPTVRQETGLSPLVGVYQAMPENSSQPYITIGQEVKAGDIVICILSLGLYHEFAINRSGVIREILVNHEDKVDFCRPLLVLELAPDAESLGKNEALIGQINNQ